MPLTEAEFTALVLSLKVALVAILGALPLAIACAELLARRQFPGKALIDGLVHLPLVLPPVAIQRQVSILAESVCDTCLSSWDYFSLVPFSRLLPQ